MIIKNDLQSSFATVKFCGTPYIYILGEPLFKNLLFLVNTSKCHLYKVVILIYCVLS